MIPMLNMKNLFCRDLTALPFRLGPVQVVPEPIFSPADDNEGPETLRNPSTA
jgi:hypothetical protein